MSNACPAMFAGSIITDSGAAGSALSVGAPSAVYAHSVSSTHQTLVASSVVENVAEICVAVLAVILSACPRPVPYNTRSVFPARAPDTIERAVSVTLADVDEVAFARMTR